MQTFIALFRGINVGGHNKLPMRDLGTLLESLGLFHVRTYIQSGNAVFRAEEVDTDLLALRISQAIEESHGFAPQVLLLSLESLRNAIRANPFPQAEAEPKTLHLYFLASTATEPDLAALEAVRRESEQLHLADTVFYLYAPEGVGRSKLAERVERALGVAATARNWRSATKILTLAESIDEEPA